jgi:hypothetical protein
LECGGSTSLCDSSRPDGGAAPDAKRQYRQRHYTIFKNTEFFSCTFSFLSLLMSHRYAAEGDVLKSQNARKKSRVFTCFGFN